MITVGTDEQIRILEKLTAKAEASLRKAPEGILNVMHSAGRSQYYYKESPAERPGKYISKKNMKLAAALAQRDYDRDFVAAAAAAKKRILESRKLGAERNISLMYDELSDVFERLSEGRRVLINPYVRPTGQFVSEWESFVYKGLSFSEDAPEIYSERGERVRSKSEKMIADKLLLMKIPYRYECPLNIGRQMPVYPDFMILDVRERKVVIYEHFGMMEDSKYACDALNKIADYEKAGYYVGKDLLFTMESSNCPLNMRLFEKKIRVRLGV